jgi:hypothetical protein
VLRFLWLAIAAHAAAEMSAPIKKACCVVVIGP